MEIVLGKLAASLLQIGTLLALAAPVFFLCMLLGGIAPGQIFDILGVTAAAGLAGGPLVSSSPWGVIAPFSRWRAHRPPGRPRVGGRRSDRLSLPGLSLFGVPLATALNPYRAVFSVLYKDAGALQAVARPSLIFILIATTVAALILTAGVFLLRIWNPGITSLANNARARLVRNRREPSSRSRNSPSPPLSAQPASSSLSVGAEAASADPLDRHAHGGAEVREATTGLNVPRRSHRRILKAAGSYRRPWGDWPILWRELMTRAYGTKPLIIKGAYLLAFALGVVFYYGNPDVAEDSWRPAKTLIPLAILSLVLGQRARGHRGSPANGIPGSRPAPGDRIDPKQFIYGKLYGVLYNAKEMVALPILLTIWFAISGAMTYESAFYVVIDFAALVHFSAMLGLHAAITYTNSRTAVANSLGTIFFLMVGILALRCLILLSDREFGRQLLSFLIFIGAGSVALFGSLGARNPSRAIALVSLLTPFWSFYCVISLLNGDILAAFLFSVGIYGFACLAMLVPAVSDFDIALGRTNAIQG